jgi:glycosyltransferase involved in cell wall biosynthesis
MLKLSVLIPAFNNRALLPALLDDVAWADEIVVVDSFSTDGTVEYAGERGAKVIQHEYINSASQKNWAIPQCAHEWVLIVDTDERIPPELQEEIRALLRNGIPDDVDAYRVARKTIFVGEWLKMMRLYPDYQTRLVRREKARYEDKEVHADIRVPGRVETLAIPLIHNSTPTLSKQINLLDRYSRYQADELAKRGVRFRWYNAALRPLAVFVYLYLFQGGWRAGMRGLFIAFHTMAYVFFTHAKLWEKEWQAKQTSSR